MRSIFSILILLSILSSCKQREKQIDFHVKIVGQVSDNIDYSGDIKVNKPLIGFADIFETSSKIDSTGFFEIIFDAELIQDVSIGILGHWEDLVIHPGDSIYISVKKKNVYI